MGFKQLAIPNFSLPLMYVVPFLYKGVLPKRTQTTVNPNSKADQVHSVYLRNWFVNIALRCREGVVYLLISIAL